MNPPPTHPEPTHPEPWVAAGLLGLFIACGGPGEPPRLPSPALPGPCALLAAPAPGPLAERRAAVRGDALATARIFVEEARRTGDPGFHTLADNALECALSTDPAALEARRLRLHVRLQFHRFAEVEAEARALAAEQGGWFDQMLLGDALMEQGKLDEAGAAYQIAADQRPGLELYDRIGWLRWLWGDEAGALEMAQQAARAASPEDAETFAWTATRLGWLRVLRGEPAPELDAALALLPDYPPARLARGKQRLCLGDTVAAEADLRAAGATVEALRSLAELDPTTAVAAARLQDPRGYADWLAPRDPGAALPILEREWAARQDATTRMSRAWAAFHLQRGGGSPALDPAAEATAALATGIPEPRVLLEGGLILGDPEPLKRALARPCGLLPSEAREAEAAIAAPASARP